ncbi:hypothetical protein ACFLX9_02465 [Chloroflexota bacterium]
MTSDTTPDTLKTSTGAGVGGSVHVRVDVGAAVGTAVDVEAVLGVSIKSSADLSSPPVSPPPTTSTDPSIRTVAVCSSLDSSILRVTVNVLAIG